MVPPAAPSLLCDNFFNLQAQFDGRMRLVALSTVPNIRFESHFAVGDLSTETVPNTPKWARLDGLPAPARWIKRSNGDTELLEAWIHTLLNDLALT